MLGSLNAVVLLPGCVAERDRRRLVFVLGLNCKVEMENKSEVPSIQLMCSTALKPVAGLQVVGRLYFSGLLCCCPSANEYSKQKCPGGLARVHNNLARSLKSDDMVLTTS